MNYRVTALIPNIIEPIHDKRPEWWNHLQSQVIAWRDVCRAQLADLFTLRTALTDAQRALAAARARRRTLEREVVELSDRLMVADRIGTHRGSQVIALSKELADARNVIVELRKFIERDNIERAQRDLSQPRKL
jgi:hypothetical protein